MAHKLNMFRPCKVVYIVFIPKYEWLKQYRRDLRDYIKILCKYKGIIITEESMMLDHVY